MHACELADELGTTTVIVPEAAGVLSALGLVASDERRDAVRSYVVPLRDAGELPRDGEADLRYRGQSFELTLPLEADLSSAFHRAHEELYGFADPEREIELVAVRTAEIRRGPVLQLRSDYQAAVVEGPDVVKLPGATVWVPANWSGATDAHGTMILTKR